jgi:hypothetical protein
MRGKTGPEQRWDRKSLEVSQRLAPCFYSLKELENTCKKEQTKFSISCNNLTIIITALHICKFHI